MSLTGRRVLVTGTQALALPIAQALDSAGARVVLHAAARQDASPSTAVSFEILNDPVGSVAQAEALAAQCWDSFGPLDGLVVVPEDARHERFADTDEDWRTAMNATLKLPFFLTRAVATRMAESGNGCIVSVIGATSNEALDVSDVTRSGSLTMTLALAKALPATIRVCAVVGPATDPTGDAVGIARTVRFLLDEDSLASGTVIRLGASRS